MFFAGLTSAYVVSMSGGYWVDITLPSVLREHRGHRGEQCFAQFALMAARGSSTERRPMLADHWSWAWGLHVEPVPSGWKELIRRVTSLVARFWTATGVYGEDYTILLPRAPLVKEGEKYYHPDDGRASNPERRPGRAKNTAQLLLLRAYGRPPGPLGFGLLSLLVMMAMALLGRYHRNDHAGLWSGDRLLALPRGTLGLPPFVLPLCSLTLRPEYQPWQETQARP
jgi:hypothetical protein